MSAILADPVIPSVPPAPPRPEPRGPLSRLGQLRLSDVAIAGVFMALFALTLRPVVDNDLFWHLATGRYIWTTGRIPHADPFSWTAPGRAWIAHEWLTETILYPLFMHGGYAALMLVFAAVITGAFAISYATARLLGAGRTIAAAITFLAAMASSHTWGVRPQMLSLLLIATATYVLTRVTLTGRPRLLVVLPPLMVLWVNLHGGFIFGLVVMLLFALGQTAHALAHGRVVPILGARKGVRLRLQAHGRVPPLKGLSERCYARYFTRPSSVRTQPSDGEGSPDAGVALPWAFWPVLSRALPYWLVFVVSLGACLLNPNGLKGIIYPFSYLGNNASTRYVAEWVPPDFHQGRYQYFGALLVLLIVGAAFSRRRPGSAETLMVLAFTHLGVTSVRNINLFSIVVAPLIAVFLSSSWKRLHTWRQARGTAASPVPPRAARPVPRGKALLHIVLCVAVAAIVLVISAPGMTARHNLAMQARLFPAGAVAYLQAHHPRGHMLNSYDWGGYLIWHLYPQMRVYIDGRPDMYGDRFVDSFIATWRARSGWQQTLRRQNVRLVLVEPTSGLGRALAHTPGWHLAYHDKVAVLYER